MMCSYFPVKLLLYTYLLIHLVKTSESSRNGGCFRAASYEHILIGYEEDDINPDDPLEYVRLNMDAFRLATEAAKGEKADIIVFPEDSLVGEGPIRGVPGSAWRDGIALQAEDVPDPRSTDQPIIPCDNSDFDDRPILQNLSCIAAENKIYLVTCLADIKQCTPSNITQDGECREDGFLMYNTQVAFDRKGTLVARYHKYHLYGEYFFDVPKEQEFIYFDTDFGARVGLYICFDRIFRDPMIGLVKDHNVTMMALSTFFFDEHPFLVSHQIDQFQSTRLGVNIVSANAKYLSTGTSGAGIFSPKYTALSDHDVGKGSRSTRPRLLIANLPRNPNSKLGTCDPDPWSIGISKYAVRPAQKYDAYWTNFTVYNSIELTEEKNDNVTICDGDFCCSLKYEMKAKKKRNHRQQVDDDDASYYFAVTNRTRVTYATSQYGWAEQVCLIVRYNLSTNKYPLDNGREFKILEMKSDNFETNYVYASALSNDMKLIANKDIQLNQLNQLTIKSKKPIIMAGLYGRLYDRDPPYIQETFGESDEV